MAASAQQPGGTMFHFRLPRVIEAEVFMRLLDHLRSDKATAICNRLGNPLIAVPSSEGFYTANVAYGGITEAYRTTILRVDVPGRPMFSDA
jgi:hypothetical protein